MDPYFLKRLWRRPWLSVCSLTLSGVLCFLMCFLAGYRQEQARQLEQAQDSFEVLCVVSNLRGNQTSSLRLWSWAESFVTSDEYPLHSYVKDLRMTKEFEVSCPELMLSDAMAVGVTNARCVPRLDPALGGGTKEIGDDFYTSRERICLVSESVYAELGEEKTVELSLRDPSVNEFLEPELGFGTYTFQIVGCYNGLGVDVYLPFGTARDIALEISGRTTVDSIAFLAADNRKLAELSEAASGKFKAVDPLAADSLNTSAALTIHDEQYRATVAALEQNLERSACLLPMLLLLSLAMGFLISLLSTRGGKPNLRPDAHTRHDQGEAVCLYPSGAAVSGGAGRLCGGVLYRTGLASRVVSAVSRGGLLHRGDSLRPCHAHCYFKRTGVSLWNC